MLELLHGQAVWMYKQAFVSVTYLWYKLDHCYQKMHMFINFFQTEHFSAAKFAMGYEK